MKMKICDHDKSNTRGKRSTNRCERERYDWAVVRHLFLNEVKAKYKRDEPCRVSLLNQTKIEVARSRKEKKRSRCYPSSVDLGECWRSQI